MILCVNNIYANEGLPKLKITNIQKGVYQHQSYKRTDDFGLVSGNGLIVLDGLKAYIIDTPWSDSDTKKLVNWIDRKGYKLAGSLSTHSHEDRTAGIKWLNSQSIPTFAFKLTNEILKDKGKDVAANTFNESKYSMVKEHIEVFYPGQGHTIDNIVVWLPKSKILFGGCLIRSMAAKSLGNTEEAAIRAWSDSVENIALKFPEIKTVIPGHGTFGNTELLAHTKKLAQSATNKLNQETTKIRND